MRLVARCGPQACTICVEWQSHEVVRTRGQAMEPRHPAGSAFVGRAPELASLGARLARVRAEGASIVLIAGEPGIGKTRLAEELVIQARDQSAAVLWGGCWEGGGAPAFWPWIQVLRAGVRLHPEDAPGTGSD